MHTYLQGPSDIQGKVSSFIRNRMDQLTSCPHVERKSHYPVTQQELEQLLSLKGSMGGQFPSPQPAKKVGERRKTSSEQDLIYLAQM